METHAQATRGELEAARKIFGRGCELMGSQTDPVYFAPAPQQAEIALIGRSNAGKSTLLNTLVGAHASSTSKRPGHTDRLRFYKLAGTPLHLVDLPGYGYAAHRQSSLREAWMQLISSYLHDRGSDGGGVLRRVLLLLDARYVCLPHRTGTCLRPSTCGSFNTGFVRRRGFTKLDAEVAELMTHFAVPFQVVLTKADQISNTPGAVDAAAAVAGAHAAQSHIAFPNINVVSAQYGYGMPELLDSLAMAAGLRRLGGVQVQERGGQGSGSSHTRARRR